MRPCKGTLRRRSRATGTGPAQLNAGLIAARSFLSLSLSLAPIAPIAPIAPGVYTFLLLAPSRRLDRSNGQREGEGGGQKKGKKKKKKIHALCLSLRDSIGKKGVSVLQEGETRDDCYSRQIRQAQDLVFNGPSIELRVRRNQGKIKALDGRNSLGRGEEALLRLLVLVLVS